MTAKKKEETKEETVKVEQPISATVESSPKTNEKSVDTNPEADTEVSAATVMSSAEIAEKSVEELADEVERGTHGSGRERMLVLGTRYFEVQQEVNRRWIANGRK